MTYFTGEKPKLGVSLHPKKLEKKSKTALDSLRQLLYLYAFETVIRMM